VIVSLSIALLLLDEYLREALRRIVSHLTSFSLSGKQQTWYQQSKMTMALEISARRALSSSNALKKTGIPAIASRSLLTSSPTACNQRRSLHRSTVTRAPNSGLLGINNSNVPSSYFQRPSLPANTIVRFVPQQTAWIVERMGKFSRILPPGLAILVPFLDRIAYVKSLKENAMEIPSQSAITADNVTLELDGVLYTRVFDAYKAR